MSPHVSASTRSQNGAFESTVAIVHGVAYIGDLEGILAAVPSGRYNRTTTEEGRWFVPVAAQ